MNRNSGLKLIEIQKSTVRFLQLIIVGNFKKGKSSNYKLNKTKKNQYE